MSKFLVGKTIQSIKIAEDKKALLFVCDDGEHIARCDGDCCSDTWVENIELPFRGFPCLVIDAADLDMGKEDDTSGEHGEVIAFYGFKISTDKGDIEIDYRNDSNGYYGGNLSWPDEDYFYGGVFSQNVSNNEWKNVTSIDSQQ